jgi:hypothetical protein
MAHVALPRGLKVVEHTHGFTPPHQFFNDVGADETGPAGYQINGHLVSPG